MSGDDPSAADDLTLDKDSIAPTDSPAGRRTVACPRCETPIALIVSYGPTTHEATPCGCRVPGSILEEFGIGAE